MTRACIFSPDQGRRRMSTALCASGFSCSSRQAKKTKSAHRPKSRSKTLSASRRCWANRRCSILGWYRPGISRLGMVPRKNSVFNPAYRIWRLSEYSPPNDSRLFYTLSGSGQRAMTSQPKSRHERQKRANQVRRCPCKSQSTMATSFFMFTI